MKTRSETPLWLHQKKAAERARDGKPLAILFDIGCLASHTKIKVNRNKISRAYTIEDLYRKFNNVELGANANPWKKNSPSYARSWDGNRIRLNEIKAVIRSGEKEVFDLILTDINRHIRATADHEIFTTRGFVQLKDIIPGKDFVAIDTLTRHQKKKRKTDAKKIHYALNEVGKFHKYARKAKHHSGYAIRVMERHRVVYEANLNGLSLEEFKLKTRSKNKLLFIDPSKFHIHHKNHNHKDDRIKNLECLPAKEHLRYHGKRGYDHFDHGVLSFSKVVKVVSAGREMTYDIKMADPHRNFVANGIVVHNCGKTRTQIEILKWHISEGRRRILVFAPPIVLDNWKNEVLKYSDIPEYWISVLYGAGRKRGAVLSDIQIQSAKIKDNPYIIITNYESVGMPGVFAKFLFMPFDILVCDESHMLKDPTTVRTKKVIQISEKIQYKYIMTGTPVLNTPMDLFSQFKVLYGWFPQLDREGNIHQDHGIPNFYSFRGKYFYDKNASMPSHVHFYNWAPRPGSLGALHKIVDKVACIARKKDVLDLPPFLNLTKEVGMGADQKKAYDEMYHDFVTYIESDACVAQLAITKGMKLMQIVSGFLQLNDEKIHRFKNVPRIDLLEELLLSLTPNSKPIVWCSFIENYKMTFDVCNKHGINYAFLTGDLNARQKSEMVEKFNKQESCRVMIANQQAGGIGINLTASDTSIYYSRNFSLGADIQSEGRNYRGGSEIHKCITRIDLVTPDSIDKIILDALASKENTAESLLRKIKDAKQ